MNELATNSSIPQEVRVPAPPMLDMLIMQLESALSVGMPTPTYVKESCQAFIDSLKKWQHEGSN